MKLKKKYLHLSIIPIFLVTTNAYASGYVTPVSSECGFCYKEKQIISTTIATSKNHNDLSLTYKKSDKVDVTDENDNPKLKKGMIENAYQTIQWVLDPEKNEAPAVIQAVQWVFDPNRKELVKPKRNKPNLNTYPTKKKKDNQGFRFAILKNTYLKASLGNTSSDINQDDGVKKKGGGTKPSLSLLDLTGQNLASTTQNTSNYKILDLTTETPNNLFKKLVPSMQIGLEIDF